MAILLVLAVVLSLGKRGFIQQIRLERSKKALAQEIEILEKEKAALEAEKDTLQTPEYTEKIAREKYGMAKKDEKVYEVVPKQDKKSAGRR